MADSSVLPWEHQATGRVLTITVCEGAGPAVWKRHCEQTECKQTAPWEVRMASGSLSTPRSCCLVLPWKVSLGIIIDPHFQTGFIPTVRWLGKDMRN